MDIIDIIDSGANIKLEVSSKDIKELADVLNLRIKEEILEQAASLKQEKKFYTREEVMEMFHIKETTLHNWVKNGFIKVGTLQGRKLFSSAEVNRVIKESFPNG